MGKQSAGEALILAAASAGNAVGFTFSVAPYLFQNLVWGPMGQALSCLVRELVSAICCLHS